MGPDGIPQAAPVRPFRKLNPSFLPAKVKTAFTLHWKPIFEFMEKAPDLAIVDNPGELDAAFIDDSFAKAKEYLKTRVEYVFQKERAHPDLWELSTWSKHVSKSFILRHGTDQDKSHFPLAERIIKTRVQHGRRKRLLDQRHVRCRVGPGQQAAAATENRLIVDDKEASEEQEEEVEEVQEPAEPEQPAEQPEAQAEQPEGRAERQLAGRGHVWDPDANYIAAAQGLVAHRQRHVGNRAAELPDWHGRLSARALERERQVDEEVRREVAEDILRMQQEHEAQRLVSDGDGGTLRVRSRRADEGLNAADGSRFHDFLRRQLNDDA